MTDIIKSQNERTKDWDELVQAVKEKVKKWIEMERPKPNVLDGPFLLYASINNFLESEPSRQSNKNCYAVDDSIEAAVSEVSISRIRPITNEEL